MPIRYYVLDNRPIVAAGMRAMLTPEAGFEWVGERGAEPVRWEALVAADPDVVLVGATLDDAEVSALAAAAVLLPSPAPWRLVVLGYSPGVSRVRALHAAGACACVPLEAPEFVVRALLQRIVACGPCTGECPVVETDDGGRFGLTVREREILGLLAGGQTTSSIAASLNLAPSTVSTFLRRIKNRLELATNHQLVTFAVTAGLVGPPT